MADAGLTNGAFYAHFSSKDDLVAHVVADQLDTQAESFRALPAGRAGLEGFLREYLSPQHRDNPADGCPLPPCLMRSHAARPEPSTPTPTVRKPSWTRSPPDWLLRIRSQRARRRLALHDGGGDAAGVPRRVRPEGRRRGARTGHPERPHVPWLRTADHPGGALELGDLPSTLPTKLWSCSHGGVVLAPRRSAPGWMTPVHRPQRGRCPFSSSGWRAGGWHWRQWFARACVTDCRPVARALTFGAHQRASGPLVVLVSPLVESTTIILISGKSCFRSHVKYCRTNVI